MSDQTSDQSGLGEIEATYTTTIPEWKSILRAQPGFGDEGGAMSREDLVSILRTDYGMSQQHAETLVEHTLAEDRG